MREIFARWHLPLLLFSVAPCVIGATELELYGFLTEVRDVTHLNLRITNRGTRPQTVLTQNPMLSGMGTNGRRSPFVGIHFGFSGFRSESGTWKFVPSLPTLAPVTLRRDETATMTIPLEPDLARAVVEPNVILRVEYTIAPDFAARFDLWSGKLELSESVGSLRTK